MWEPPSIHHGRVVFEDRRSAAGALVSVATGSAPTPEIGIRCDDEGRFRIALPRGRFVIEARAADGRVGRAEVDTVDRAGPVTVTVVIGRAAD